MNDVDQFLNGRLACSHLESELIAYARLQESRIAALTDKLARSERELEEANRRIVSLEAQNEQHEENSRTGDYTAQARAADAERKLVSAESDLAKATAALATATAQVTGLLKDYFDVADAVCRESKSVSDVCQQARETRAALTAATARCGELEAKTLKWHKGPALGGEGTAGKNDEGVPQWYDGDRLLIIVEMTSGDEMAIVDIIADEDLFQVKDATTGDTYDAWEPAQWSWWAKFNKHNLPSAAACPDAGKP